MRREQIHIISKFTTAIGGSEQRAFRLAEILDPYAVVHLWSTHPPDASITQSARVSTINPWRLRFPKFGTFVFVGSYLYIGDWIRLTHPTRKIVVFNTDNVYDFSEMARKASPRNWIHGCEIVYACEEQRVAVSLPGMVQPSPIDVRKFVPSNRERSSNSPFVVGRLSRDYPFKFHDDDALLFRCLGEAGFKVKLLGGTCLHAELDNAQNVELIEAGAIPAPDFLRSLDCFIYRTSTSFFETYGRVVLEAMATGLPVICSPIGGYAKYIEPGINGFFFDDQVGAINLLTKLRSDPTLRRRIGSNARRTVEKIYSDEYEKNLIDYYLGRLQPVTTIGQAIT
jgi:glycosyltransferase involved in cell wall biosynthesis